MDMNSVTNKPYSSFATRFATFPLKDSKGRVSFFWGVVLGLRCCAPGLLLVAVHRLLTAVASLVAEHGL